MIKISNGLYAKAELMNPTGSIKDRPASWILKVQDPKSKGFDTICEATSGNMGVSFAWLAASMGLTCVIVMPDNMSKERKQTLEHYGARLIEVEAGNFDRAIEIRDELCEQNGWFNCNQFGNKHNIEAHSFTTGQEILNWAVDNKRTISAMVTGTGTGGTLMGCHERMKPQFPDMKMVAVEPSESAVMSGGEPGLHGIQGIGDGSKFLVSMDNVDYIQQISTEDAKATSKRTSKNTWLICWYLCWCKYSSSRKIYCSHKSRW